MEKCKGTHRETSNFKKEIRNIKMKDSLTVKNHYSRLKEVINQMRAYGGNVTDKKFVEKILASLIKKI